MFRNRGEIPNIQIPKDNNGEGGYRAPHYSHYWNGRYYVIHYDKTFVAIELISWLIIFLTIFAVYLFEYKVSYEDPIATIKSHFLNGQLISILISITVAVIVTFVTRSSKENLIRNLRVVAIISVAIIIVFLGIKINMDDKYNENAFGEFYEQYENNKDKNNSKNISVKFPSMKILNEKEAYIENSKSAYTNFSVKTILYMIIHFIVVAVIFYLSCRLSYIERKKAKLAKDDIVLYDEEENIKI